MLDDDIVLKNCYYWAKKMVCKGVDFNELVSIGYLVGKPLKDPKLLKDWICYSMQHFIVDILKRQCNIGISDFITNTFEGGIDIAPPDYSELYKHIVDAGLSKQETITIQHIFFEDLNQEATAALMNITQPTVSVYLNRAIEKIKRTYIVVGDML